jgi:hypothetical protein
MVVRPVLVLLLAAPYLIVFAVVISTTILELKYHDICTYCSTHELTIYCADPS